MDNPNTTPDWMQDESVQKIDKEKLAFLYDCFTAVQGKDKRQLMTVLGGKLRDAKKKGLQFTPEEMNIAVTAIKKNGTQESNQQIDDILSGKFKNPFKNE